MIQRIPKITLSTSLDSFFSKLKPGSIFRYSYAFMFFEIKTMANRRGVNVEYCSPGSREHRKHGDSTVRVIEDEEEKEIMFHFNPQYLDI